jgi:hypothetical protein
MKLSVCVYEHMDVYVPAVTQCVESPCGALKSHEAVRMYVCMRCIKYTHAFVARTYVYTVKHEREPVRIHTTYSLHTISQEIHMLAYIHARLHVYGLHILINTHTHTSAYFVGFVHIYIRSGQMEYTLSGQCGFQYNAYITYSITLLRIAIHDTHTSKNTVIRTYIHIVLV